MRYPVTQSELFWDAWASAGDDAFEILSACEVPPSFEVFRTGLEEHRQRAGMPVDVRWYAQRVVDEYQQIS